jgi:hypothetical protein
MASRRLGPLPRIKGRGALGRGCGREGRGALPLPRAAAVSTGQRLPSSPMTEAEEASAHEGRKSTDGRRRSTFVVALSTSTSTPIAL